MDGIVFRKDGIEFQISNFEFNFNNNGDLIARHTDTGNTLIFGSDGSITGSDIEATSTLTDPSGTDHTGELADSSDVSSIQSSSDVDHDSTTDGTSGNPHADSAGQNVGIEHPVYASTADVPDGITEGETVYIQGDGLYVEDGT